MEHCEHFTELISQSLDNALSSNDHQALQQHLEQCPECRLLSQQLFEVERELRTLEEQEVPEGFTQGVMDRIRALEQKPNIIPIWKHPQFKAFGSIAACALICVGLWRMGTPNISEDMAFSAETSAPAVENSAQIPHVVNAPSATADEGPQPVQFPSLPPAALPEAKVASPVQDCTSYSSTIRSEGGFLPSEEVLLQTVRSTLGIVPGELLLMDVIPEAIAEHAVCYTTEAGFLLYVPEEAPDTELMQDYKDSAVLVVACGDGPSIFVSWNS